MRTPLIAGNWKMFKTIAETMKHVKALRPLVKDITDVEIVVAPAFTSIHAAAVSRRGCQVHGAAPDHFMTHLAIWEAPAEGEESEWGDQVTDADYVAQPTRRR